MSNSSDESAGTSTDSSDDTGIGISDDQLPDDLVPSDDNPLAESLDPEDVDDDLLDGGKLADEMDDDSDERGSDPDAEA